MNDDRGIEDQATLACAVAGDILDGCSCGWSGWVARPGEPLTRTLSAGHVRAFIRHESSCGLMIHPTLVAEPDGGDLSSIDYTMHWNLRVSLN